MFETKVQSLASYLHGSLIIFLYTVYLSQKICDIEHILLLQHRHHLLVDTVFKLCSSQRRRLAVVRVHCTLYSMCVKSTSEWWPALPCKSARNSGKTARYSNTQKNLRPCVGYSLFATTWIAVDFSQDMPADPANYYTFSKKYFVLIYQSQKVKHSQYKE